MAPLSAPGLVQVTYLLGSTRAVMTLIVSSFDRRRVSCRVAIKFLARGVFCKNLRAEITNHMMLVHPHIIEAKEVNTHFAIPSDA